MKPSKETTVRTPDLGRNVTLRKGTSDEQVWADTFTGRYHLPPGRMPAPSTILDLGANIGLTAAHYRSLWPAAEIVAVEMDSENAALAKLNAPGVAVRTGAVSDRPGVAFYDDSIRSTDAYALGNVGTRMIVANTLRQIILRSFEDVEERGGVDFVKMDVEGMEWNLFEKPEWAPLVRHLLVELHAANDVASDFLVSRARAQLRRAGFEVERHEPHPQAVFAWR